MTDFWVGLDVGTSASKAVAYDASGTPVASARSATRWNTDDHGVSIDPLALRAGALLALMQAIAALPAAARVAAVGITSMGETGVLTDAAGAPVAPAIAWHDSRDDEQVLDLERSLGADPFRRRTGKPLRGQFSLTKHRWLLEHVPAARHGVRRFNVAEWVALGLGAEPVCDLTLACRTGWYDLHDGGWWADALAWSGASEELMPPLVASGQPIGEVEYAAAGAALRGAVITLAGHDHQAAMVGLGAEGLGVELDSCGTAEALVRTVPAGLPPADVATLAASGITTDISVQAGRWSLLGGTEGGLAMQRTLGELGMAWGDLDALDDAARLTGPPAAGSPGRVWRAVVAQATSEVSVLHDSMTRVAGAHRSVVATGGWCASATVVDARRALFGDSLRVVPDLEAGARGAAVLAARASGDLGAGEQWPLPAAMAAPHGASDQGGGRP